jgi:hypothetical protein
VRWQLRIVVETALSVTWRSLFAEPKVSVLFFDSVWPARGKCNCVKRGDFVFKIRAELTASVEKSGGRCSRTNVVCKSRGRDNSSTLQDRTQYCAAHIDPRLLRNVRLRRYPCYPAQQVERQAFRPAEATRRDGRLARCENDNVRPQAELFHPQLSKPKIATDHGA